MTRSPQLLKSIHTLLSVARRGTDPVHHVCLHHAFIVCHGFVYIKIILEVQIQRIYWFININFLS